MLHWLSQIVWRREHEVLVPNELLCLHVALECLKLEIIPVDRSPCDSQIRRGEAEGLHLRVEAACHAVQEAFSGSPSQ
jgi:hypothetical protein